MASPRRPDTPWDAFIAFHDLAIDAKLTFETWLIDEGVEPMHLTRTQLEETWQRYREGEADER
jgi:hypothetical protein